MTYAVVAIALAIIVPLALVALVDRYLARQALNQLTDDSDLAASLTEFIPLQHADTLPRERGL